MHELFAPVTANVRTLAIDSQAIRGEKEARPKGPPVKFHRVAALLVASVALSSGVPLIAQTVDQTKAHTDTNMKDGVATTKTTVTRTHKRKTRHPRKILGVKVGTKTDVSKTVEETSDSSNGDTRTTVTTSHP